MAEYVAQLLSAVSDLKKKSIELLFSLDVDEDTVSGDTIYLLHHKTQGIVPLSYEVDEKKIIVTVKSNIRPNDKYYLNITNELKAITDESFEPVKGLVVTFNGSVVSDVEIVSPKDFEVVEGDIFIKWHESGEKLEHMYELEIAGDNAFGNVVYHATVPNTNEIAQYKVPAFAEYGQYYIRIRAINSEDNGSWSRTATFTYRDPDADKKVPNPQPEPEPTIVDHVSEPKKEEPEATPDPSLPVLPKYTGESFIKYNEETPTVFTLDFDQPIDITDAVVTVKRKAI